MTRPVLIRRVFFDCTATAGDDINTGIQRVVRNIVNAARDVGPRLGIECRGVVFDLRHGFVPIDQLPPPRVAAPLRPGCVCPGRRLRTAAKEWLAAARLLQPARAVRELLQQARRQARLPVRRRSPLGVRWQAGDVLLLIDTSWVPSFSWTDVCEAQARGALVGTVLYDLIPLQYPQVVGEGTKALYARWWRKARTVSDFVVAISRSVLDDIAAVDRAEGTAGAPRHTPRCASFRLAGELDDAAHAGPIRDEIAAPFAGTACPGGRAEAVYLMVGMISPRKNHRLALDAFDLLWNEKSEAKLAIAGRYGWDCEALRNRIVAHPQYGRRLFWFQDCRDHELDYLYRRAAGLLTCSYAEGFNLPIVEALRRGCPVLASDLPVHREVGGPSAAFFSPNDPALLAAMIARRQPAEPPSAFRWPDWTESCRELIDRVLELSQPDSPPAGAERWKSAA